METEETKQNSLDPKEENDFSGYDDQAEFAREQAERDTKVEEDKVLPPDPDALLEVRHLKKYFTLKKTVMGKPITSLKAVDDVSFKIRSGETLGIVGESGCGKTTMGRTILKLHQPTSGQIFFEGKDIAGYKLKEMNALRTKMQIVFQDPYSSLPPRSTVGDILAEPVKVHKIVPPSQIKEYVLSVMEKCGLRRSETCRLRRAGFRARRFHSGADYQPSEKFTEGKTADVFVYFARFVGREIHFRPYRRHVSGFDGRIRR